jgi:hypothetical protein
MASLILLVLFTGNFGTMFKDKIIKKNSVAFSPQSELYRLIDRHLTKFSANVLRIKGCRVISAADPLRSLISVF